MTAEPSTEGDKALFKQVRSMPGNNFCADCNAAGGWSFICDIDVKILVDWIQFLLRSGLG
jgi:hypothetical protein